MIAHLAVDSWNAGAVDHYADRIGGRGHDNHVGRGYDHNPAFQSRGHDQSHVCRGHCRSRADGHGHSLSGSHSPFCQAHSSVSHAVCRHGDIRLLLAHPSRNERDRASFCGEVDVPADGKNHGRVGATVAVEIFEENADASLEEGGLEEPQSRAWVEVEVLKTFHFLVCALFALSSLPMSVTVRPRLHPLASLSQIQSTPSAQDGVPHTIEEDLRAYGCKLIHQAGILLNQSVSFSSQFIKPPHAQETESKLPWPQPRFSFKDSSMLALLSSFQSPYAVIVVSPC